MTRYSCWYLSWLFYRRFRFSVTSYTWPPWTLTMQTIIMIIHGLNNSQRSFCVTLMRDEARFLTLSWDLFWHVLVCPKSVFQIVLNKISVNDKGSVYRVIQKTLNTCLEIYFWDWVYQAKDWFIILDKGAQLTRFHNNFIS